MCKADLFHVREHRGAVFFLQRLLEFIIPTALGVTAPGVRDQQGEEKPGQKGNTMVISDYILLNMHRLSCTF